MLKKIVFLCLSSFFGQLIYSCTSCSGVSESLPFYDIQGYSQKTYKITGLSNSTIYEMEELNSNDAITYDQLAIILYASHDYYASNNSKGSIFNTAYACDPLPPGYEGTKELIDTLYITSMYDFNDDYPKGTKLNELFEVYTKNLGLDEYLDQDSLQAPRNIGLILNTKPDASEVQKFKISIHLSSGESYITETSEINFE